MTLARPAAHFVPFLAAMALSSSAGAQTRLVGEVFAAGGSMTMSTAARDVYGRAGGLQQAVGIGLGLGIERGQYRASAFYVGIPNELPGRIQSFSATNQMSGVRLDVRVPTTGTAWSFVPSIAVTVQARPGVAVLEEPNGTLTPVERSNGSLGWNAGSVRALAGVERAFGSRYAFRAGVGPEVTFAEGGTWRQFSASSAGAAVGIIAEAGLRVRIRGARR